MSTSTTATRCVEYNYLGNSGLKVSNMCYGTNTFGTRSETFSSRPGNLNESEAHALLDRFSELGGNFIDTADIYNAGQAERIIGTWLAKQRRERYVIATKCGFSTGDPKDPNSVGLSRHHIMNQVEASLQRLGTEYIDLFQIHRWDAGTPVEETLTALDDLVHMGKIRYLGASNVTGWQLQKMVDVARERGLTPLVSLQAQYSLVERGIELELIDVCRNEGLALLPWAPFKGGWLSGKIKRGMEGPPEGTRVAWASQDPEKRGGGPNAAWQKMDNEKNWAILDAAEQVVKETGHSMPQVAIRWLLQKDTVTSVVFGARTRRQMDTNMAAGTGWSLSEQQMALLDEASDERLRYPYDMLAKYNKQRGRNDK